MQFLGFNQPKGGSYNLPAHGPGWGKGNIFSCNAFYEAKNEIRRWRRKPQ